MEAWKKFAEELDLTHELQEIYFKLRLLFIKEGWTEEDLKSPPYYPERLMSLRTQFGNTHSKIRRTIANYGFEVSDKELSKYLNSKLEQINKDTPLRK